MSNEQTAVTTAHALLQQFKGDHYAFGLDCLDRVGPFAAQLGKRALLVGRTQSAWCQPLLDRVTALLDNAGVQIVARVQGAAPNSPREDVYRLALHILSSQCDLIVSVESGSGIDACKAAAVIAAFGDQSPEIDAYLGMGKVSEVCEKTGRQAMPVLPVMTAAGSAAHLTKYSNITDPVAGQKKLIIDEAIVPTYAVFDYALTQSQPESLTLDGALDGLSHCLEVYLGAKPDTLDRIEPIALTGIELIIAGLQRYAQDPADLTAREYIGLGTDLGGYAIMVGGTNGPHLNSFSLVKYLAHGRACALMCPYYTLFFSPAVDRQIQQLGRLYQNAGYLADAINGRTLAQAMIAFNQLLNFPTKLADIPGIDQAVLTQALNAAKDPALASKLQNMPIPLDAQTVDQYMAPLLDAAWTGDPDKIVLPKDMG